MPGDTRADLAMDPRLDQLPCGFVAFGDDGIITSINATLLDRLGYAAGEVIGRHVESLLGAGARIFYQTHFFPLLRLHGRAREVYMLLQASTGEQVGVLCNGERRDRAGQITSECVFFEVVERRKFEEALLAARKTAEAAHAALSERTRELERANMLLEEQAVELELQHQQMQEQAAELEAHQDQLQELNVALRRQAEELERQKEEAEKANHAKSSFLAVMSHELRTPLNAIGGYVQLLEMEVHGPVTDGQRGALQRVDRSQRHLLRLINDVLNLARIEAGRVDYVVERVSLAEVVGQTVPLIEPQALARDIPLTVAVPDDIVASADREKVQQILLNLLGNAVKFTAPGGAVRIDAQRDSAAPHHVHLKVSDTGSGIPPEMLQRIFEPFVQVDVSHRRPAEGTGLGLAISRDLARGMGGDLSATSTLGVGSTFDLALPSA